MKKILLGMAAIVALVATSCQKSQDFAGNAGETATVSFSVNTPEMGRAYSDGSTATALQYAIYDETGAELTDLTKTDATINGSTSVNVQLVTGQTYTAIFWAAAPNAPYTVDFDAKTMEVSYTDDSGNPTAVSNDEKRDAFFKKVDFTVSGNGQNVDVKMQRPFAQLNIGTNDYAASTKAGYTPEYSHVTVSNIYKTLNLWDGTVADKLPSVEFTCAKIPTSETFPVAGYEYLAMNYLLVPAKAADEAELIEVEFAYKEENGAEKTRTVGSVPVNRNHRTNIYGSLLTSDVNIKVEIEDEYDDDQYQIYNVVVNGVSYDNFADAVAKAMELNKPIEFIQNVAIDADETITVPAGKELTIKLNGYTLNGVSNETTANRNMFDVRGTMTVNGANTMARAAASGNGVISISHDGDNMGWNNSTNVFNVTAGGVLNIKNVHAINYGGSDMGFVAHLNNWGEVTLNIENSTLESNYVAVRVFNSGNDMNNVTIKNSTLKGGSYAFWVQCYTAADFGNDAAKVEAHKALLNFDIFNGTNEFIGKNDTPIRYGFTDSVYANASGLINITDAEGNVVEGVGLDVDGNYAVTAAEGLTWIAAAVAADNDGFAGETIKLNADVTVPAGFNPIGYNPETKVASEFKGVFDGNGKSIKGIGQQDLAGGYTQSVGVFGKIKDATIKNLTVEDFTAAKYGAEAGLVASVATGDCTFENITVKNGSVVSYNNDTSAILGWGNVGNFVFKNITIDSTVTIYSLWDSYDTVLGGVIGTLKSGSTATLEDITVACKLDAYNDVCSNYQWGAYRRTGMLIGNMNETQTINGTTYPDPAAAGVTCNNVKVIYGDWMNYHYCEFKSNGHGSYDDDQTWKHSRVEGSDWGSDGVDTNQCNHESFESHNICLPVDQLFGGGQGVYGLAAYPGVTVTYPASYNPGN